MPVGRDSDEQFVVEMERIVEIGGPAAEIELDENPAGMRSRNNLGARHLDLLFVGVVLESTGRRDQIPGAHSLVEIIQAGRLDFAVDHDVALGKIIVEHAGDEELVIGL